MNAEFIEKNDSVYTYNAIHIKYTRAQSLRYRRGIPAWKERHFSLIVFSYATRNDIFTNPAKYILKAQGRSSLLTDLLSILETIYVYSWFPIRSWSFFPNDCLENFLRLMHRTIFVKDRMLIVRIIYKAVVVDLSVWFKVRVNDLLMSQNEKTFIVWFKKSLPT